MTNSDGQLRNLGFDVKNSISGHINHLKTSVESVKSADFQEAVFVTPRTTGQLSYARSPSFPQSAQNVKAHCQSVSDINTTPAEVDIVGSNNADAHQLFTIQY